MNEVKNIIACYKCEAELILQGENYVCPTHGFILHKDYVTLHEEMKND